MTLLSLLVTLIVVGFLLWAVNTYVPMHPAFKAGLNVVVVLVLIVWLAKLFLGGTAFNRTL